MRNTSTALSVITIVLCIGYLLYVLYQRRKERRQNRATEKSRNTTPVPLRSADEAVTSAGEDPVTPITSPLQTSGRNFSGFQEKMREARASGLGLI